jgi:hypothetical protein
MFVQGYFQFLPSGRWFMSQDPFPESGHDGEEPDGFLPPAAAEDGPEDDDVPEDDEEFHAQQGLYVCLPAEQLTLAGFAQNGGADTMTPGGLLATVVQAVTGEDGAGLAGCDEDQLCGIVSAGWRLESRAAWTQLAAIAAFAARRRARGGAAAEFIAEELAAELHLTPLSAAGQIDYAIAVTGAAAQDVCRAGRRVDPPSTRPDHRGRDQHPQIRRRRPRRCAPLPAGPRPDLRGAAARGA